MKWYIHVDKSMNHIKITHVSRYIYTVRSYVVKAIMRNVLIILFISVSILGIILLS